MACFQYRRNQNRVIISIVRLQSLLSRSRLHSDILAGLVGRTVWRRKSSLRRQAGPEQVLPRAGCVALRCARQLTYLDCPAAFNITGNHINATPTAAVRNLEHNCRNSSNAGCSKRLGFLQKLKVEGESGRKEVERKNDDRASKMLSRDCQLMGLAWLLARNKTAYIPTVSAVLRAILYSANPSEESRCSLDQENMPLAVDSLQLEKYDSSSSSSSLWLSQFLPFFILILPLIFLVIFI
ncbi:uncharacterized GPI-anchored At4g28100 [Olea europaea subsp. europaea]|uniref:Uncharacterized GPI-anchored At4g28100 n=1 Tax=Olea europaea subsp. europaea TaxID=158383 RepID=A0A8S0SUD9_OLEEU|nr:uncharacterized GPI-anchored At4g28100 [Olea europaea subsp. europaea]